MQSEQGQTPAWVLEVMSLYRDFDASKSTVVRALYADDVVFADPIHEIKGIDALETYFGHIGQGLNYCNFSFFDTCAVDNCAWLKWRMDFSHPRLSGGKPIAVLGSTELRRSDKIYSHTDFYDMGAMVYEHVPLLGGVTQHLKKRLGQR